VQLVEQSTTDPKREGSNTVAVTSTRVKVFNGIGNCDIHAEQMVSFIYGKKKHKIFPRPKG